MKLNNLINLKLYFSNILIPKFERRERENHQKIRKKVSE
jgi:hypothetical protein